MTANNNVLLAADPTAREVLLGLIEGCQDLREATARLTERSLNAPMSLQTDLSRMAPSSPTWTRP